MGYTETKGSPELRQVVAQIYQTIESEDILIHAGAEEAIFIFMNIALQPEDHIIVHRVSASKFVALDTDKFGSINKEWLDFPETTPDL